MWWNCGWFGGVGDREWGEIADFGGMNGGDDQARVLVAKGSFGQGLDTVIIVEEGDLSLFFGVAPEVVETYDQQVVKSPAEVGAFIGVYVRTAPNDGVCVGFIGVVLHAVALVQGQAEVFGEDGIAVGHVISVAGQVGGDGFPAAF